MPTKITVDFYQSCDGPCLLLFGGVDADLSALATLFAWLSASKNGDSVDLDNQSFISVHEDSKGIRIQLLSTIAISETQGPFLESLSSNHLIWRYSPEMWAEAVEQIQGMIDFNGSCHQYLAQSPENDLFVKLSIGEIHMD